MEFGRWKLGVEAEIEEVHARKEGFGLSDGAALAEDPGNEFKLSDVVLTVDMVVVDGIADEVESGDTETLFVNGIIVERIFATVLVGDVGDADDSEMGLEFASFAESKGEIARSNTNFFAVGDFVVKIAPKIRIFSLIECCSAHVFAFRVGFSCLVYCSIFFDKNSF